MNAVIPFYWILQNEIEPMGLGNEIMLYTLFQILILVVISIAFVYLYILIVKYLRLKIKELQNKTKAK